MTLAPDVSLGSRYRLLSRIAVGGMGEVWRAEDLVLHRQVAVKVLRTDLGSDPSFLERFRLEARNTAALTHPGIASVYDYGEVALPGDERPDTAYLVMELVDGDPLSAILHRDGRLDADRTLDILGQAAAALQAAHDHGMVHRDVKPGNILVRPDGTVKITDFGIARAADAAPLTRTGTVLGTAYYLSPEQAQGHPATPASDLYSLGVVGYESLAGQRPFTADNPVTVAMMHLRDAPPPLPGDVPAAAASVVERAMAKDPAARFRSAAEMGAAAAAARAGRSVPAAATASMTGALGATRLMDDDRPDRTRVLPAVAGPGPARPRVATPPRTGPPTRPAGAAAQRRRGPTPLVLGLVALLVALLIAALIAAIRTSGAGGTPGRTPASAAATVTVNPDDYIGRPYDEVAQELRTKGLVPRRSVGTGGGDPGTVTDLNPSGQVARGSRIVVTVAPEQTGAGGNNGSGGGHPAPQPKPTPSPTPVQPTPTIPATPVPSTTTAPAGPIAAPTVGASGPA